MFVVCIWLTLPHNGIDYSDPQKKDDLWRAIFDEIKIAKVDQEDCNRFELGSITLQDGDVLVQISIIDRNNMPSKKLAAKICAEFNHPNTLMRKIGEYWIIDNTYIYLSQVKKIHSNLRKYDTDHNQKRQGLAYSSKSTYFLTLCEFNVKLNHQYKCEVPLNNKLVSTTY